MTRNYQEIDYDVTKAFDQNPAPEDRSPAQKIFSQPLSGELNRERNACFQGSLGRSNQQAKYRERRHDSAPVPTFQLKPGGEPKDKRCKGRPDVPIEEFESNLSYPIDGAPGTDRADKVTRRIDQSKPRRCCQNNEPRLASSSFRMFSLQSLQRNGFR